MKPASHPSVTMSKVAFAENLRKKALPRRKNPEDPGVSTGNKSTKAERIAIGAKRAFIFLENLREKRRCKEMGIPYGEKRLSAADWSWHS
jgi:hypothetical protein